ncbi:uncharacterized protein PHACADRAFT_263842 [Phanerochaete carnosa HHB-10118-sp]|uniref:Chromo domain-containing protein n=1 Tax=Phanerochaete carnosa (strain HHB-10118-sp) TaxID=650164 RepID=K5WJT2_PHACS|nr:uncharacterized protein PHACADRAFT_263842 [Phanerochaete carnosa HHB-10118-sp]EKM50512.1 hypothetical protein PHACADRAFT_263842 [Phanerochaete carnosa HHB-10118-sp]
MVNKVKISRAVDENEVEEVPPSEEEGQNGEQEEEEYEIEKILDAKPGTFEGGKLGYLVKWKGYEETHNSWVSEADAINCQDLIQDFWNKRGKKTEKPSPKKPATASVTSGTKSSSTTASRKRATPEDEPNTISAPPKRRGRPPKQKPVSESEDDAPAAKAPAKRGRPSMQVAATQKVKDPDAMDEDEDQAYFNMGIYKDMSSWESLIDHVDTVERMDDGKLIVYFKLTKKHGNKLCREESRLCRQKFPNLLLDFYEHNLRWRPFE